MFVAPSLLDLPILIVIWLIEAYLSLAALRLVLSASSRARQSHLYGQLKLLTDLLPDMLHRCLAGGRAIPVDRVPLWFLVICAACLARGLLISVLLM
jgi:hypothetical protein